MKRIILTSSLSALILIISSCKKDSTSTTSNSDSWTIYGTTYQDTHQQYDGTTYQMQNSDINGNAITLSFYSTPTTGEYILTSNNPASNSQCTMVVYASVNVAQAYFPTGNNDDSMHVTVTGNQVTATFKNVTVEGISNGDSTNISGTLVATD